MNVDLYPPLTMPESPTWADIERMALHYPACHGAVVMVQRGEWTREEALVRLVFAFAIAWQGLFSAEIERLLREPRAPFVLAP